jgi:hypothetical protein
MNAKARMRHHPLSHFAPLPILVAGCVAPAPCPVPVVPPPPPPLVVQALPPRETVHESGVPFTVVRRKNHRIEFGGYGVEVDPADGGRIVEFSLGGKSIILPLTESPEAFGSSIWPSPQSDWNWPPPLELDRLPWQVISDPKSLVMQSETSKKLGLSVRQRITAEPDKGSVLLEYEFFNHGSQPRKVAPWQNTRVRPRGLTFYPASRPTYNYKYNTLVLAPEDKIVWFAHDPTKFKDSQKSFADGEEGWLAHLDDRLLFIKVFDDVKPSEQAPEEGEIVLYVHDSGKFVEVENQGAFQAIQPGSSITWTVRWVLRQLPDAIAATRGSSALAAYVRATVAEIRR